MTDETDKARDRAAQAEALADRIEATDVSGRDVEAEHAIAAMLLGPADAVAYSKLTKRGPITVIVNAGRNPIDVPGRWRGQHRGMVRNDFATDLDGIVALVDQTFGDTWGWDIIRWPRGQGVELPSDGLPAADGPELPTFDAELTPPAGIAALGRDLIGQHRTAGGALLAAIMRAYAFKLRHEAGVLDPVEAPEMIGGVRFDIDETQRAFIADIVDRAEELDLSPREARTDRMMDIAAVHCNGCALNLEGLLHHATDFAFTHDFKGIVEHIDRTTGKLGGEFLPRYAMSECEPVADVSDR